MKTRFSLREFGPEDGKAYAALLAASPDTGMVGVASRFEMDPYEALMALHGDTVGVVAETPGYDGLVGSGLVRFGELQWQGNVRPSAILNTLVVHPDFRRRGLASQLAAWREDYIKRRFGEDGVIWAVIQRSNAGSERTAKKWASEFLDGRLAIIPMRARTAPPKPSRVFTVRPVDPGDLETIAERSNQFYREYDFYPPESGASLAAWLEATPFETPIHHYWVVTDTSGELLAGLGLSETCRLRTAVVTHMPATLRLLNRVLNVVPPDGVLRELGLNRFWFAPGQKEAARYLLNSVRWEWRNRGTAFMVYADLRSPLIGVLDLRPWTMKTVASIALKGPTPRREDRLCYYPY